MPLSPVTMLQNTCVSLLLIPSMHFHAAGPKISLLPTNNRDGCFIVNSMQRMSDKLRPEIWLLDRREGQLKNGVGLILFRPSLTLYVGPRCKYLFVSPLTFPANVTFGWTCQCNYWCACGRPLRVRECTV